MLESQNSLFVSDALKDVLNYESLYEPNEEEDAISSNVLLINGEKFELDLLTVESTNVHQNFGFKMQLRVPALNMADYLCLSKGTCEARINDVSFELQGSDLHWDVKNKIMTCSARLKDGELTV
jgi:hypothetical protein